MRGVDGMRGDEPRDGLCGDLVLCEFEFDWRVDVVGVGVGANAGWEEVKDGCGG